MTMPPRFFQGGTGAFFRIFCIMCLTMRGKCAYYKTASTIKSMLAQGRDGQHGGQPMILSDQTIISLINEGSLIIEPLEKKQIQPESVFRKVPGPERCHGL